MMKRIFIILLILIPQNAFSQGKFLYEAELGVNASSKPYKDIYSRGKGKSNSLFSPLVGFSIMTNYQKRFSLSAGIQFYQSGKKYEYHGKGVSQSVSYSSLEIENMIFTQISFPIQLKYNFSIRKLKMNTFIGYTFSNFIKGSYYYKSEVTFSTDIGRDYLVEKSFDPFSKDLETPAKRTTSLVSIGVGMKVHERIGVQLGFSAGLQQLYFEEYPTPGAYPDSSDSDHYFSRCDLALTVKYLLNK